MPVEPNEAQWREIEEALFRGEKINAIGQFCHATGAKLADGKKLIEEHESLLREKFPEKFTARAANSGCTIRFGMILLSMTIATVALTR